LFAIHGLAGTVSALDARAIDIGNGSVLALAVVDAVKLRMLPKLRSAHLPAALYTRSIDVCRVALDTPAALRPVILGIFAIQLLALLFWRARSRQLLK